MALTSASGTNRLAAIEGIRESRAGFGRGGGDDPLMVTGYLLVGSNLKSG